MKKLFIILAFTFSILLALAVLLSYFVLPQWVEPRIQQALETQVGPAIGAQVRAGRVHVASAYPLNIEIHDLQVEQPAPQSLSLAVKRLTLRSYVIGVLWGERKLDLETYLQIEEPRGSLVLSQETPQQSAHQEESASSSPQESLQNLPLATSLSLVVSNGSLHVHNAAENPSSPKPMLEVALWQFEFSKQKALDFAEPASLSLHMDLTNKQGVELSLPMRLNSESLYLSPEVVQSQNMELNIGGLKMSVQGKTQLSPLAHQWQGQFNLEDLSQLSVPPEFLPPGRWQGGMSGHFRFQQNSGQTSPYFQAQFSTQGVQGHLNWREGGVGANGPASLLAQGLVIFKDNQLSARDVEFKVNLDRAHVMYKDILNKASQVPLNLHLKGYYSNQAAVVQSGQLQFAQIRAQAQGFVDLNKGRSSNFRLQIPQAQLNGMEKHIGLLSGYPIQGVMELKAKLSGDVQDPEKIVLDVEPLRLQNVSARINYVNEDQSMSLKGPLRLNVNSSVSLVGQTLKQSSVQADVDLSQMAVSLKETLSKKAGENLGVSFRAQGERETVRILSSHFNLGKSRLNLNGTISQWQKPKFSVKVNAPQLNLGALSRNLHALSAYGLSGSASAQLEASGGYDFDKGIEKSPIQVKGKLQAQIPAFKWQSKESDEVGKGTSEEDQASVPKAFVPDWPLIRQANVQADVKVGQLVFNDLKVTGLSWKGGFQGGRVQGALDLQSIFSGKVALAGLRMNLLNTGELLEAKGKVSGLKIQEALAWALPEYKDWGKGQVSSQFSAKTLIPLKENWLDTLTAQGSLSLDDAFLSTLKFDEMANEKLVKIPGISQGQRFNTKGVLMDMQAKFSFKNRTLFLKNLNMKTPENNELVGKGSLSLNLNVDIEGELHLANSPVKGSVKAANSDPQGRFVVPMKIDGNLLDPDMSFAENTIETILDRTVAYEEKKLKKKVEKKVQEGIEKETEKLKKSVGKKLKDLIGQ